MISGSQSYTVIMREDPVHIVFVQEDDRCYRRHHNKDHRRKDTDGSKSHAVPLHPVEHTRDGYHVLCLIVVILVLLENAKYKDASRYEYHVCADDNEQDRREEKRKCLHGFLYRGSKIIGNA